nr:hypothetical protein [Tanacetum cinerariifolium]GFA18502.1 hypothetical protein [Tanacetum cinerariifolium]
MTITLIYLLKILNSFHTSTSMEKKDILSLCPNLEEREIQRMQKQAKIMKQSSMYKFDALKSTFQHLSNSGNECSERIKSGNDMDIRPSYDTEPIADVLNIADYNVFAIEEEHTWQPEFINDTYVMEKDDSNVNLDSSDMSHNKGKVDQHVAKHDDERVLLSSLIEN